MNAYEDKEILKQVTPMMQQYLETKKQYHDCILFYRLGDFYEMFFEDANIASRVLELTLTGKSCGLSERAPMCGIPYHAVDSYLTKLVKSGYKVAIVEQVEDPALAKGLVKREVTRIVTPGTNVSPLALDETKNHYLMCITAIDERFGIATCDVSTGDFYVTEVPDLRTLTDEIHKFSPIEIICNQSIHITGLDMDDLRNRLGITVYTLEDWYFDAQMTQQCLKDHFQVADLSGLGMTEYPCGCTAAGSLLRYLMDTQKNSLEQLTAIHPYSCSKYMILDTSTRRNLELVETLREKQKKGSLLGVLDKTKTAMGARLLRSCLEQPLIRREDILLRQDAIADFNQNLMSRDEIREYLNAIYDLERLISKIAYRNANPRDFIAFRSSLAMLPGILCLLADFSSSLLTEYRQKLDPLEDIQKLLMDAIDDDPPITVKEGGMIKAGFSSEVDRLRSAKSEGKNWLSDIQRREQERTGIKSLKVKYNQVFGYYIEVSKANLSLIPEDYVRKQTLVNAERFITPELKELESKILGAEEKSKALEYQLFQELRNFVLPHTAAIQRSAAALGTVDVLAALAECARKYHYHRPLVTDDELLSIKAGRHPVLDARPGGEGFVPNDVLLDGGDHRMMIITGPNMAGKSTYIRQTALLVIMAQMGSFIPADEATIGLVDRIFTRVGAADDLSRGQSTFMVEMIETANILNCATNRSLVILDEIGRGTSTFDGLSIAWAVAEFLHDDPVSRCRTQFATHYHELTELARTRRGVNNYNVAVREYGDRIIFLRQIVPGSTDRSYGIHVAKLAGLPAAVIRRANEILETLENSADTPRAAMQSLPRQAVRSKSRRKGAASDENPEELFQPGLF